MYYAVKRIHVIHVYSNVPPQKNPLTIEIYVCIDSPPQKSFDLGSVLPFVLTVVT